MTLGFPSPRYIPTARVMGDTTVGTDPTGFNGGSTARPERTLPI
jgi:hypothetical protein